MRNFGISQTIYTPASGSAGYATLKENWIELFKYIAMLQQNHNEPVFVLIANVEYEQTVGSYQYSYAILDSAVGGYTNNKYNFFKQIP